MAEQLTSACAPAKSRGIPRASSTDCLIGARRRSWLCIVFDHVGVQMMGSRFGRSLVVALAVGILSVAAPASAASGSVSFADGCGAVTVDVTTAAGQTITYVRNGVQFDSYTAAATESKDLVGASANDTIAVEVDGATVGSHAYSPPNRCTAADVSIRVDTACNHLLALDVVNHGNDAMTGFQIGQPEALTLLPAFPSGTSQTPVGVPSADFGVFGPAPDDAIWFSGHYSPPTGCDPAPLHYAFKDNCASTQVTITSTSDAPQLVLIDDFINTGESLQPNDGSYYKLDHAFVSKQQPLSMTLALPRPPGENHGWISVFVPGGDLSSPDMAELLKNPPTALAITSAQASAVLAGGGDSHHHDDQASCVHPSSSPRPSSSAGAALPVTGTNATAIAAGGALLLLVGSFMVVVARRRRAGGADIR